MGNFVVDLAAVDRTHVAAVGGKGANLGELSRVDGIRVPPGFCVTTDAFRRVVEDIAALGAETRGRIETAVIPEEIASEIAGALHRFGEGAPFAVRSSATVEDSPGASFAGQHDTYLNVVGLDAILRHVSRCWASLFNESAVSYRVRNGFDHSKVYMAVVVQQMVSPRAAGVLFTADPMTSSRKVAAVEATVGLGETLVSGLVNTDIYRVHDNEIISKVQRQEQLVLSDPQVVQLVQLGRRIEAHFGEPQDIEWCLVDDDFDIVQSRPITTLFPIPSVDDHENHVYVSVGHQQMMTDPMKPLGLSIWQLTAARPMYEAGGRLFVDVTAALASPASRASLVDGLGRSDPLIGDALRSVVERGDFVPTAAGEGPAVISVGGAANAMDPDPAIVTELIASTEASIAALKHDIQGKSGTALLDFILADVVELKRVLFNPRSSQVFLAAMDASRWLNDHMQAWLGEKNVADVLTRSVPHNVTSEMGMALLDVADAIRSHPEVIAFLQQVVDDGFLEALPTLPGGRQSRDAIWAFLDKYGMRCVGEIDITRPRWIEHPSALVPMILANVQNFAPGEGERRFEEGRQAAAQKEHELLERVPCLPDGEQKAEETARMIELVRTFIGYREYPKYGKVSRELVYKQALMAEADRLVQAGVIAEREDVFFLRFEELHEVVRAQRADSELIHRREQEFRSYEALTPPRVLTSDGEAIAGSYHRDDAPAGALVGLAVSGGTVEGRARIVLDMEDADVEPGDILLTAHTDPSWSPLFVAVAGLVTEVGGLMTHGAVVAREYGLPAVVGVEHVTELIRDGQRIRVNGTDGYVEILSE